MFLNIGAKGLNQHLMLWVVFLHEDAAVIEGGKAGKFLSGF
jgi:hypothetical protein